MPVLVIFIVFAPLLVCWFPLWCARQGRAASAWSATAVLAAPLAVVLLQAGDVFTGETQTGGWDWLPQIGLRVVFRLDGLGLLFCLLILGIGLLVVLYAAYYLPDEDPLGRFYAYLLLFAGAMLGVGGMLVASMLYFAFRGTPSLHELLITLFLFISTPVSAHLLVKAALHLKVRSICPLPHEDNQGQA